MRSVQRELTRDKRVHLSRRYVSRHNLVDAPRPFQGVGYVEIQAHTQCVEFSADLEERELTKWLIDTLYRQSEEIGAIQRGLRRINNAILALPEGMTATFRDELEHDRST